MEKKKKRKIISKPSRICLATLSRPRLPSGARRRAAHICCAIWSAALLVNRIFGSFTV